jgi:hypothetical protein
VVCDVDVELHPETTPTATRAIAAKREAFMMTMVTEAAYQARTTGVTT